MGALYGEIYIDWHTPIDQKAFALSSAKLKHRSRAGQTFRSAPGAALVWANAGTPNDSAVDGQPWVDRDLWIAFDGALHNRAALLAECKLPAETRLLALLVTAWRRFGPKLAQHLQGNFVLVVIDFAQRKVCLARDPLGARALHYQMRPASANTPACLRFASEVDVLVDNNTQPCPHAVANYFAFARVATAQTMFAVVQTLAAGVQVTLHNAKLSINAHDFDVPEPIRKITDAEAIQQFRTLLDASILAHSPASGRLGISLSGGLDSNALFALSANQHPTQNLRALSWQFGQLKMCDESEFSSAHATARQIEHIQFGGDALTVLCAPALRPISLSTPQSNIYRELKTQLYARAAQAKVQTVFNGAFGDHLFADANECLSDALARWDLSPILREYLWRLRRDPRLWRDVGVSRMLRRALGLGVYQYRHLHELTPFARTQTQAVASSPGIRAHHFELNLGAGAQFGASGEAEFAERFGIDLATPYRSPALLRFMLSLPVHLSQRRGISKWILREAMHGKMPEAIRVRPKSTSLQPFFDTAIAGPARAQAMALLFSADADWPRFYQHSMVKALFESTQRSDAGSAKLWRCMGYELWRVARGLRG